MAGSCRVLGLGNGKIDAPIMFVGEAPGRLGADDTALPFHGDRAGENFEQLIAQVGISRYECFITNAVLCNPKDDRGNNATPNREELKNCAAFLRRQIEIVNPQVVVSLGNQALQALSLIESHSITLAAGVRKQWTWHGRILIPLYHPGQRAMLHRSFLNQLADYRFVAEVVTRLGQRPRNSQTGTTKENVANIARLILAASGPITYFRLHKLFYLVEYHFARDKSRRLTSSYVVRQKDGPYFTDLHLSKLRRALPSLTITQSRGSLVLSIEPNRDLFNADLGGPQLAEYVESIVDRYRAKTDPQLKSVVYLTAPMRSLLRREKYNGANLFNAPIDFSIAVGH
jgi:uracil-DNA glycosylase family 4